MPYGYESCFEIRFKFRAEDLDGNSIYTEWADDLSSDSLIHDISMIKVYDNTGDWLSFKFKPTLEEHKRSFKLKIEVFNT